MNRLLAVLILVFTGSFVYGQSKKITVYIFLGETCPICQYHTLTLNQLNTEYAQKGIEFIGVFPNPDSDSTTIEEFRNEYQVNFTLQKDKGRQLMKKLQATITPQVFVVGGNDSVYYKGRIDDRYETLGKRKRTPVVPDLQNALDELLAGKPILLPETKPVGCFIDSEY